MRTLAPGPTKIRALVCRTRAPHFPQEMRDVPIDKEAEGILSGEIPALCPSSLVLLEDVKRV